MGRNEKKREFQITLEEISNCLHFVMHKEIHLSNIFHFIFYNNFFIIL